MLAPDESEQSRVTVGPLSLLIKAVVSIRG
jgi:hypothetical protein